MRIAALAIVLCAARPAWADFELWDIVTTQVRQHQGAGFVGWTDLQVRRKEDNVQLVVRPAVGYAIDSDIAFYAGYAWIPTIPEMGDTTSENRLWQQARWTPTATDELRFEVRPRLEERWLINDDQVAFRARFLGRVQWTPSTKHKAYLAVSNELFINLNDTETIERGFDQNRLFAGVGIGSQLQELRVEAGYQNIWFSGDKDTAHVIVINFVVSVVFDD